MDSSLAQHMSQLLTEEEGKVSSISVYKELGTEIFRKCVIAYSVPATEALSERAVDGTHDRYKVGDE